MDEKIEENTQEPWFQEGLRFKCTECGKCCTGSPGYVFLSNEDINKLADHFQCSVEEFTKQYVRLVNGQAALLDRPGSYDCIFLKDNKCSAYESRPVQCKTFPWWVHNLKGPEEWEEAGKNCEGINHPDAPLVPSLHIQVECLSYLDNLLDQNFYFEANQRIDE